MALNNQLSDEWPTNRLQTNHMNSLPINTTNGSNGNVGSVGSITSVGPKKIIRNLALKRIKESIPLENKVIMSSVNYHLF